RQARGAHVTDHRALRYPLPGLVLAEARHVRVQRGVTAAVVEYHGAAVAALPAGELHARVAGGHDRRAGAGGVVDARVHPHLAQHRMPACTVARAKPRVRDRHADEALLQRTAVQVEVLGLAVALEAQPGLGLAAGREPCRQHFAGADALALAPAV